MTIDGPSFVPTHPNNVELERLSDEIAELAAHLDAATARLLDLIREFDARGGWVTASPRAPTGLPGVSGSRSAPRASTSEWHARSEHCHGFERRWPAVSWRLRRCER